MSTITKKTTAATAHQHHIGAYDYKYVLIASATIVLTTILFVYFCAVEKSTTFDITQHVSKQRFLDFVHKQHQQLNIEQANKVKVVMSTHTRHDSVPLKRVIDVYNDKLKRHKFHPTFMFYQFTEQLARLAIPDNNDDVYKNRIMLVLHAIRCLSMQQTPKHHGLQLEKKYQHECMALVQKYYEIQHSNNNIDSYTSDKPIDNKTLRQMHHKAIQVMENMLKDLNMLSELDQDIALIMMSINTMQLNPNTASTRQVIETFNKLTQLNFNNPQNFIFLQRQIDIHGNIKVQYTHGLDTKAALLADIDKDGDHQLVILQLVRGYYMSNLLAMQIHNTSAPTVKGLLLCYMIINTQLAQTYIT